MKMADNVALVWFAAGSAVSFLAFGWDKWRAARAGWRVSERTLVWLGVFGGWPGGVLGMLLFRHKTAKGAFQLKYALALVAFAAEIWAWLHWR